MAEAAEDADIEVREGAPPLNPAAAMVIAMRKGRAALDVLLARTASGPLHG